MDRRHRSSKLTKQNGRKILYDVLMLFWHTQGFDENSNPRIPAPPLHATRYEHTNINHHHSVQYSTVQYVLEKMYEDCTFYKVC